MIEGSKPVAPPGLCLFIPSFPGACAPRLLAAVPPGLPRKASSKDCNQRSEWLTYNTNISLPPNESR